MNKLLCCVFQIVAVVTIFSGVSSCKFDDVEDKYPYTTAFFAYQDYNRNLIVGEGLKMNVIVTLSGVFTNKEDRIVRYKVDPSLLNGVAGKTLLPDGYYSLGHPNQIVILKGDLIGYLPVVIDSAKFLAHPKALTGEFVLPISITKDSPNVDTVFTGKSFIRISLSYRAKQFGNYQYAR